MSITIPSRDDILTSAIAYFQVAHRDPITGASPPMGPRSFSGQEARALANLLADVLGSVKATDDDAIPGTYVDATGVTRTRNSSLSLDDWAYALGLPSSTPGVFGRKSAQAASGGAATAYGTAGITVLTNAQLTDPSGKVVLQIGAGFVMPGGGSQSVSISAVTTGLQGNLDVGTILRWSSPPPGLAATVTLSTKLSGGYDLEDDVTLALRIISKLQSPLRGGTAADYRFWCENAFDSSGRPLPVNRAYPLPGRNGTGSIDLCITQAGTGAGRDPDATVATQVATYVETVRPVGDGGVRIVRPYFPSDQKLTIRVRVQPATGYAFDWDDSQGSAPATTSTGSSGTSLILNTTSPPASLKTAVDSGNQPRVQLSLDVLPFVARVTAYALNTPSGKCTLTLDTTLTSNPGSAGCPCTREALRCFLWRWRCCPMSTRSAHRGAAALRRLRTYGKTL